MHILGIHRDVPRSNTKLYLHEYLLLYYVILMVAVLLVTVTLAPVRMFACLEIGFEHPLLLFNVEKTRGTGSVKILSWYPTVVTAKFRLRVSLLTDVYIGLC